MKAKENTVNACRSVADNNITKNDFNFQVLSFCLVCFSILCAPALQTVFIQDHVLCTESIKSLVSLPRQFILSKKCALDRSLQND